jgi:hypothetical protein
MQTRPVSQGLSQPPQCAALVSVSTHVPPHSAWPDGQPQVLPLQVAPPLHALPHSPQWSMLEVTSTQVPLQSVCPGGQPQLPALQVCPAAQAWPQAPQLRGSLWKLAASKQPVPHNALSAGHVATQAEASHSGVAAGQAMPQPPQWAPSAAVFAQPVAHAVKPAWHMQLPLQIWPGPQATPQPPQLATSLAVFEQLCPHEASGGGQLHEEFTQVCVPPHTLSQAPQ